MLSATLNEKTILQNFIAGSEQAFETLFKKYYQLLLKVALFLMNDREAAEELVHDVFLNVWEKRSNINPDASFKNYLITATRNRCFNHLKAKKATVSIDDENWTEEPIAATFTESPLHVKEMGAAIEKAVNALPEQCRIIFQLSRHESMSYKEIAEALDIAPKTVENQIGRALKTLRIELQDFFPLLFILMN